MTLKQQITTLAALLTVTLSFFWGTTTIYAADCTDVAPGGNLTLTTACMFPGTVNGVDSGTGTTNTAVLTLDAGGTLTVGASQTIAMGSVTIDPGGSIVFIDGGSLRPGLPLWMTDADGDGIPDSIQQVDSSTQPAGTVRRDTVAELTVPDANPAQSCPVNFNPSGNCNFCSAGAIAFQSDGSDIFGDCQVFYACNGSGSCTRHAKRIFLSSGTSGGNLNKIAGADSSCQSFADGAALGGSWKAWISSRSDSAGSRMSHSAEPYILTDDATKIADNWTNLTSGTIAASINKTETGTTIAGSATAWTNTNADGSIFSSSNSDTCSNWTANGGLGSFGTNDSISSAAWSADTTGSCSTPRHLYCVEQ